jgi:excisionase family DNA binding protein
MPTQDNNLCSTREAAALLGVSLRTAQLWVESGVLRAWKTAGGHRRILRSSVDALLQDRKRALQDRPVPGQFKLLIVEDDADLLKLYRMHIEAWGLPIKLVTASNGFEGLIRIGEAKPGLVIADLSMPGMDGFRMIRSLRANADFRDMDIVVVTALGKDEIADRGGLPEDIRVFTKPAPFSALEQLVREKVERPR